MLNDLPTLKVYELEPRRKHATVFEWFDNLDSGASFVIENNHDPLPLYYELMAERKDRLSGFEYLQKGPDLWKVRITRVAEIANQYDRCAATPKREIQSEASPDVADACSIKSEAPLNRNQYEEKPNSCSVNHKIKNVNNSGLLNVTDLEPREITVGEIAAKDIRKAEAMWKMGIDFCCGGSQTISQAAAGVGISITDFYHELEEAENNLSEVDQVPHEYNDWDADFLADFIHNRHHKYFYDNRDRILQLAKKVRQSHGHEFSELIQVNYLIEKLSDELNIHFYIEENLLFPYIKELVVFKKRGIRPTSTVSMSKGSLSMMHSEHEYAGDILKKMRNITCDYQIPDGACYSVRSLYRLLQELDKDLRQHIHLENNILFPKALKLEKELC